MPRQEDIANLIRAFQQSPAGLSGNELLLSAILDTLSSIQVSLERRMPAPKPYLTTADVKLMLNISDTTLRELRRSGALVPCTLGTVVRYRSEEIDGSFRRCDP